MRYSPLERHHRTLPIIAVLLFAGAATSAAALEIELHFGDSLATYPSAREAITQAAQRWEAALADPIVIVLDIGLSDELDFFTGAESEAVEGELPYAELRDALVADATTELDATAIPHLPPGPLLSFRTLTADRLPTVNEGSDYINEFAVLTSANAKALGFDVGDLESDGTIWFNQSLLDVEFFDLDPSDGIEGYDLVGIATHEMAHILGFNSGVDIFDFVFDPGLVPPDAPPIDELNDYSVLTSLDLFRYSAASGGLIDMTPGVAAFFSVDGGATAITEFATGVLNGDGLQASHWSDNVGVMDGQLSPNVLYQLTKIDLQAIDAIGWDVRTVPEPSSKALIALLGASILLCSRYVGASPNSGCCGLLIEPPASGASAIIL